MEQESNETYLTVQEAAQYTNRSTMTINRWIRHKRIQAKQHTLSRRWLIRKEELDRILNEFKSN